MQTIRVERILHAPAEKVFDLATDHAGYTALSGVTSARLVSAGTREKNGVGAVREIQAGPIRIQEEVTAFERPRAWTTRSCTAPSLCAMTWAAWSSEKPRKARTWPGPP